MLDPYCYLLFVLLYLLLFQSLGQRICNIIHPSYSTVLTMIYTTILVAQLFFVKNQSYYSNFCEKISIGILYIHIFFSCLYSYLYVRIESASKFIWNLISKFTCRSYRKLEWIYYNIEFSTLYHWNFWLLHFNNSRMISKFMKKPY